MNFNRITPMNSRHGLSLSSHQSHCDGCVKFEFNEFVIAHEKRFWEKTVCEPRYFRFI